MPVAHHVLDLSSRLVAYTNKERYFFPLNWNISQYCWGRQRPADQSSRRAWLTLNLQITRDKARNGAKTALFSF